MNVFTYLKLTGLISLLIISSACSYLDKQPDTKIDDSLAATLPSPSCIDINQSGWFTKNEKKYAPDAHTTVCHVGKSINGLIGRLENRGGNLGNHCNAAAAASTYSSAATVQRLAGALISANTKEINRWYNNAAGSNTLGLSGFFDETTGTVVSEYLGKPGKNRNACSGNKAYTCLKSKKARVVLRKTSSACFLLTSYPT